MSETICSWESRSIDNQLLFTHCLPHCFSTSGSQSTLPPSLMMLSLLFPAFPSDIAAYHHGLSSVVSTAPYTLDRQYANRCRVSLSTLHIVTLLPITDISSCSLCSYSYLNYSALLYFSWLWCSTSIFFDYDPSYLQGKPLSVLWTFHICTMVQLEYCDMRSSWWL